MPRSTKIVATLGPASSDPEMLDRLIAAGVDVVRLNFSHGRAHDHIERARLVREIAARHKRGIAILADLQGPKIRLGTFAEQVMLHRRLPDEIAPAQQVERRRHDPAVDVALRGQLLDQRDLGIIDEVFQIARLREIDLGREERRAGESACR